MDLVCVGIASVLAGIRATERQDGERAAVAVCQCLEVLARHRRPIPHPSDGGGIPGHVARECGTLRLVARDHHVILLVHKGDRRLFCKELGELSQL